MSSSDSEKNRCYPWREAPPGDFAVIGDPVQHSRSPQMHAAAYQALGLPYRYLAIHVPAGEVGEALAHLRKLGYQGVNATIPHKGEVFDWCQTVDPFAARVEAVNTVQLETQAGTNTDGPGFMDTLEGYALRPTALVLGAGGSARACVAALADAGYQIRLYNRTAARAEGLNAALGSPAEVVDVPDPEGCALILNSTSASLTGDKVPVEWSNAMPDALAYDLAYGQSHFLREASGHGLRTIDGLPLLVAQGARAFEWWLHVEAPRNVMMEAVR